MSEPTTPPVQQTVTSSVVRSVSTETGEAPIIPTQSFISWVQHSIFALFGIGFVAWAVMVWGARDDLKAMYIDHMALTKEVQHLEDEIDGHVASPGHGKSLEMHAVEQRQLNDMQDQVNRRFADLQREIDSLHDREYRAHDDAGRPKGAR